MKRMKLKQIKQLKRKHDLGMFQFVKVEFVRPLSKIKYKIKRGKLWDRKTQKRINGW